MGLNEGPPRFREEHAATYGYPQQDDWPQRRPPEISGGTSLLGPILTLLIAVPQRKPPEISGGTFMPRRTKALKASAPQRRPPEISGGTLAAPRGCSADSVSLNEGPPRFREEPRPRATTKTSPIGFASTKAPRDFGRNCLLLYASPRKCPEGLNEGPPRFREEPAAWRTVACATPPQRRPPEISGGTNDAGRWADAYWEPQRRPPEISGGTGLPSAVTRTPCPPQRRPPEISGGTRHSGHPNMGRAWPQRRPPEISGGTEES